ncbi:MAG: GatB/YqeY domain-containing protein [Candidatus Marinimicrobia bacterium]|nr:GatB/YqeY domain-containing protein [Candidatus Neomarinimicrobiota bacterium]
MKYLEKIQNDLKIAMKSKDKVKMITLRSMISMLKLKQIDLKDELNEKEEIAVINKEFKNRKESFATYSEAGRDDLAEKEKAEMDIIETYLPKQLGESEIVDIVKNSIKETGAESMKDMGILMKNIMPKIAGKADGKIVQTIVKKELGS